jgi:hypothetical protein
MNKIKGMTERREIRDQTIEKKGRKWAAVQEPCTVSKREHENEILYVISCSFLK